MKFTINTKEFLKSLQVVGGLIKTPNHMPILDNVLINLSDGKLQIVADNLEVRSTVEVDVNFKGSYSTCIPYQLLVNMLKGFPNAPVDLVFNEKTVVLQSKSGDIINGEYKIPIDKAEEFPKNKYELAGEKAVFNSVEFVEAIRKASSFIDTTRVDGMSNLLLWITPEDTKIVGGTGNVIYEYSLPVTGTEKRLLLSKTVVSYLSQSITTEEVMEVSYTDNHIFLTLEGRQISAILGNLAFPKYESLFNKISMNKTFNVDKDYLMPALRRICNVTDKNSFSIDFSFNNEELEMSFNHYMQKCDAKENLKCDYTGEPLKIGFNANHISNVLSSIDSDIVIQMLDYKTPCLITGENTRCLMAPMMPTPEAEPAK